MIPAGHSSAGGPSVAGHPDEMAAYADELTEMDMATGRAANQLKSTLNSLFERQTREVDMVHRPVPTSDDWRLAGRIVDHATAVSEADGWVGMVGRALFLADGRDGYDPHVRHAAVSQQDLDDALAELFPPLSPTGGDRLDMAIGALEGIDNVQQAENNRRYVSQVVFQQHVDGPRRAVIYIYQVQIDGTRVRVAQQYGRINPDGTVGAVS